MQGLLVIDIGHPWPESDERRLLALSAPSELVETRGERLGRLAVLGNPLLGCDGCGTDWRPMYPVAIWAPRPEDRPWSIQDSIKPATFRRVLLAPGFGLRDIDPTCHDSWRVVKNHERLCVDCIDDRVREGVPVRFHSEPWWTMFAD